MERKKAKQKGAEHGREHNKGGLRKREREDFHDATSQAANKTLLQRDAVIIHRYNIHVLYTKTLIHVHVKESRHVSRKRQRRPRSNIHYHNLTSYT